MTLISVSIFTLDPDKEFWLNSKTFGLVIVCKYSGTLVVDHNSFEFVGRIPICSRIETFFPKKQW